MAQHCLPITKFGLIVMIRICPNPMPWSDAFERLTRFAKAHPCTPSSPPKPLILAGWAYSNDMEKMRRWEDTIAWATDNGCVDAVSSIPDEDFYFASEPTTYAVGPAGDPMYRPWDFDSKRRPSQQEIARHFETLKSRWSAIVGSELAHITQPLAFTGEKARRLLVRADGFHRPPFIGGKRGYMWCPSHIVLSPRGDYLAASVLMETRLSVLTGALYTVTVWDAQTGLVISETTTDRATMNGLTSSVFSLEFCPTGNLFVGRRDAIQQVAMH